MLAIVAALVVGAFGVAMLAGASAARARAQTAADLAALGAATAAMYASAEPCQTAREVAQRNGAVLISCVDERAGVFAVTAEVPAPGGRTAQAPARAGPASAAP